MLSVELIQTYIPNHLKWHVKRYGFKFEIDFKSNMNVVLAREDGVLKLPVPQITGSS